MQTLLGSEKFLDLNSVSFILGSVHSCLCNPTRASSLPSPGSSSLSAACMGAEAQAASVQVHSALAPFPVHTWTLLTPSVEYDDVRWSLCSGSE